MRKNRPVVAPALAFPLVFEASARSVTAQAQTDTPAKSLGVVTVNSGQPTSLPTQIPATIEGVTREQIAETVNATDSEDALKYLPSLLVRMRYVGDYNHAVLSSRASGKGNSARSAAYADGILLSNYLGNGATYAPRRGMVSPEEIERVDVMYGPYPAAYPGLRGRGGGLCDAHAHPLRGFGQPGRLEPELQALQQQCQLRRHPGQRLAGQPQRRPVLWVHVSHTDSTGQPPVFAARLLTATAGAGTTPLTGAVRTLSTTTSRVQNIDAVNPKAVASLGIDNLTDETYWSFHPYPQRTYVADLRVNF